MYFLLLPQLLVRSTLSYTALVVLLSPFSFYLAKYWRSELPGTNKHVVCSVCNLSFRRASDKHSLFFSKHFSNVKGKKNERIQRKTVSGGVEVVKTLFDT